MAVVNALIINALQKQVFYSVKDLLLLCNRPTITE